MRTRCHVAVTIVLALVMAACVSRAGTPEPTRTNTGAPSFSVPPTDIAPDQDTMAEVAQLVSSLETDRFNDRVCPGSHDIEPVTSIGPEYAAARGATIGRFKFIRRERTAVVLDVPAAPAQLLIGLGVDYNTGQWCAHTTMWCPTSYAGLPPFVNSESVLPELDQRLVCNHGPR